MPMIILSLHYELQNEASDWLYVWFFCGGTGHMEKININFLLPEMFKKVSYNSWLSDIPESEYSA